jgi:hypothetical protein
MFDFMNLRMRRAEEIMALQRLFDTPDGEKALKWFMRNTGAFDSSVGADANETYFLEGKRAVGLELINALKMPYEKLIAITQETDLE